MKLSESYKNRMSFLAGLNESENKKFTFKVKHDKGTVRISTHAASAEEARKKIMSAEGCPAGALTLVNENSTCECNGVCECSK